MVPLKTSLCRTLSNDQGWVIALVLMILAVTMGLTMASASLVLFHMKSSSAFSRILQDTLLSGPDGEPLTSSTILLGAPEGWDHIHFSTKLTDRGVENVRSYSWCAAQREQCQTLFRHTLLPSQRPHILVIIDDSTTMLASSGHDYDDDGLYLKRPAGGIVRSSACCEISETYSCMEGTYFRGSWGNANERAPSSNGLYGAMPAWTYAFSMARSLINSLDQCEIAVMSISRGLIQPFSHDGRNVLQAMESTSPSSPHAPLAESLYQASRMFPGECVSSRHILMVTAGTAINDGHLPAWLKDYDRDDNPADSAFEGLGSHCLDDVAAYVRSLGISVHVMGPGTTFLRDVAVKGGGLLSPGTDEIAPEGITVTGPLVMHLGEPLVLSNLRGRFHPTWLQSETGPHMRPSITEPSDGITCPDISVSGILGFCAYDSSFLFCTTSRNQLAGIDLARRGLSWLYQGTGGMVLTRNNSLITGPGWKGLISRLSREGSLCWQQQGTCMDSSESLVYVGNGSLIQAHTFDEGFLVHLYDTNNEITMVRYDPVTGAVTAGSADGLLFLFDQNLNCTDTVSSGENDPIVEIRNITLRRVPQFLALTSHRLICCTTSGPVWSISLDAGAPVGMTVMGGHVFVVTWDGEAPCRGLESGISSLLEVDASTGELLHSTVLGKGIFFGPSIDLEHASMKFVGCSGEIIEQDISSLQGVMPCKLGRKIILDPE